jgi:hypothetical protein
VNRTKLALIADEGFFLEEERVQYFFPTAAGVAEGMSLAATDCKHR